MLRVLKLKCPQKVNKPLVLSIKNWCVNFMFLRYIDLSQLPLYKGFHLNGCVLLKQNSTYKYFIRKC